MKLYVGMDAAKQNQYAVVTETAEEALLVFDGKVRHIAQFEEASRPDAQVVWDNPRTEYIDSSLTGKWQPSGQPPLPASFTHYSDAQLHAALKLLLDVQPELQRRQMELNRRLRQIDRQLTEISREQASRKAISGGKPDWETLLMCHPADTMLTPDRLGPVLQRFDLHLDERGTFFRETMQHQIELQMVQGKEGQVERVAQGLEEIIPYITPFRNGTRQFFVRKFGMRAREKFWLIYNADGTCELNGSGVTQSDFSSLRDALSEIQKHHFYSRVGIAL